MPETTPRLLPWTGSDGKPCYLITDDDGGPVSRLADVTEATQLGMGRDLLAHARALLPEPVPPGELRVLAEHLAESLRHALRIADSRGHRLRAPGPGAATDPARKGPALTHRKCPHPSKVRA